MNYVLVDPSMILSPITDARVHLCEELFPVIQLNPFCTQFICGEKELFEQVVAGVKKGENC